MASGDQLFFDLAFRCSQIFVRVKYLFSRGDIVGFASEQIDRAGDVIEIQAPPKTDKHTFGKSVLLEDLYHGLKIPATGKVDGMLIPTVKSFFLAEINWIVDVFVKVNTIFHV